MNRRAARILVVDRDGRVLLFSPTDRTLPNKPPIWFSVGGEVDPGETMEEAAIRELREETGLRIDDPGPVVLTRQVQWNFEGGSYDHAEVYYFVRTDAFEPAAAGWTDIERATFAGHRWWSVDDLRATSHEVYPEGLADILQRLVEDGSASDPGARPLGRREVFPTVMTRRSQRPRPGRPAAF